MACDISPAALFSPNLVLYVSQSLVTATPGLSLVVYHPLRRHMVSLCLVLVPLLLFLSYVSQFHLGFTPFPSLSPTDNIHERENGILHPKVILLCQKQGNMVVGQISYNREERTL